MAVVRAGRAGNRLAQALASEGYAGGYRDALDDVQLLMNGVEPDRRGYWLESRKKAFV
jgi:hypothetical protein